MLQVNCLSLLPTLVSPTEQGINSLLDIRRQSRDSLLGEDRVPRRSTLAMEVMVGSSYDRHVHDMNFYMKNNIVLFL